MLTAYIYYGELLMMNKGLKDTGYLNKIFNFHDLHYSGADAARFRNGSFQME